jgi:hypothetical protein
MPKQYPCGTCGGLVDTFVKDSRLLCVTCSNPVVVDVPDYPVEDMNVERLVFEHRRRVRHGFKKYGTTTDRNDLTLKEWVTHAKEEAMDQAVYLQKLESILELDPITADALDQLMLASMESDEMVSVHRESINRLILYVIQLRGSELGLFADSSKVTANT